MKTITITLYEFNELSDPAKEKARDWYRNGALDYDWWDSIYNVAKRIGLKITSFDLDRARHAKGEFIHGALETAHKIEKKHGESCETFQTAKFYLEQRDKLVDSAERDEPGEFVDESSLDRELDDLDTEFLRSLLEDYSIMLQKEYEYLLSDECVDETISANGYTFTESGKRFG